MALCRRGVIFAGVRGRSNRADDHGGETDPHQARIPVTLTARIGTPSVGKFGGLAAAVEERFLWPGRPAQDPAVRALAAVVSECRRWPRRPQRSRLSYEL